MTETLTLNYIVNESGKPIRLRENLYHTYKEIMDLRGTDVFYNDSRLNLLERTYRILFEDIILNGITIHDNMILYDSNLCRIRHSENPNCDGYIGIPDANCSGWVTVMNSRPILRNQEITLNYREFLGDKVFTRNKHLFI